jgi:hypothetical protein
MKMVPTCISVWLAVASVALCAEPFARVTIDDNGRIVPGQQVHVTVDVFVPDFFTSPPQFPLFDLPNAIVTLPDERAQNIVQTIDGVQYSGISRTYAVVPETSGTFTLPPATIELGFSQDGKPVPGEARLPPTSFTVAEPSGVLSTSLTFAARGLTITQSFDRDPATLKVGDAVVRTITIFAGNTQAMMIPAISATPPDGLKVYTKPPRIEDGVEADDGSTGSSRTETITYVAERAGAFEIPEVSYPWFDVDAHEQETARLPSTAVEVVTAVAPDTGISPEIREADDANSDRLSRTTMFIAAAVIAITLVTCWMIWRLLPLARERLRSLQNAQRNSERRVFKRLITSIRVDDPTTVYRNLESWARSAGFGSIGQWVSAARDTGVMRETGKLERELFGRAPGQTGMNREALAAAVRKGRALARSTPHPRHRADLPELNPNG